MISSEESIRYLKAEAVGTRGKQRLQAVNFVTEIFDSPPRCAFMEDEGASLHCNNCRSFILSIPVLFESHYFASERIPDYCPEGHHPVLIGVVVGDIFYGRHKVVNKRDSE